MSREEKPRKRVPIGLKLTVLTTMMIVLTSGGVTFFFIGKELVHSYKDLAAYGLSVASMTAGSVEYGIYAQDTENLAQIAETVASDKNVLYVIVTDTEGRELARRFHEGAAGIGLGPDAANAGDLPGPGRGKEEVRVTDNGSLIDITAPVVSLVKGDSLDILGDDLHASREKTIGYVRVGLTKEACRRRARQFVVSSATFTTMVALAGVVLAIFWGQRLTLPLKELARTAQRISQGDLDQAVSVKGNDEIAELASAFRDMLERLRESRLQVEAQTAALGAANKRMEREIAERRQAQEALRALNEGLEVRVRERTQELERAYEELKELDRLKDAFLSSVSHELRTPLTSIRSFSEILLAYPDTDAQTRDEFISIINTESERLTRLVNDVLDLSKIKAGKIQWDLQEIDVESVVRRAVQSQQGLVTGKGLRLQVDMEPGLPRLRANEDKIIQVLTNLLSNAIKFTPEGGAITVQCSRLRSRRAEDTTDFVQVSVRDTGVGISEEDLPKLFTPFTQCGHDTLTDKPPGTGLGLSIAKEIIAYHGGNIWVESTQGRGSAFHFTVPAVEGRSAGASAEAEDAPRPPLPEEAHAG
jgi:signal transduction histidine kinase